MYYQCSLKVLEWIERTGEVVVRLCVLALYTTAVAWTRNKASAEFLHLMSLMWVLHMRRRCSQSNHLLMCNLRGSEPGAVTAEMLRPPKLNFYHAFIFTFFFFFANINKKTLKTTMHERTCCEDITVCPVVYLILTLVCHRMGKTATNIG